MKRGALNMLIREAPEVWVRFSFGDVEVKKGSLIQALTEHFPSKADETGLTLLGGNTLSWETSKEVA